jgi:hypothetical protein
MNTLDLKSRSNKANDTEYSKVNPSKLPLNAMLYHDNDGEYEYRNVDTEF